MSSNINSEVENRILPTVLKLGKINKKIPILLKTEDGKALFYGKLQTKPILYAYATNPFLHRFEKILKIVEEEIVKILAKACIANELIKISSIENNCDTIIITIRNRKGSRRGCVSLINQIEEQLYHIEDRLESRVQSIEERLNKLEHDIEK